MSPARANRYAVTLVMAGVVALVLVLGLWQGVDAACDGEDFDPADPVTTCQPPDQVEQGTVPADD